MTWPIVETDGRAIVLDFSCGARLFGHQIAELSVHELSALIDRSMQEAGTGFAVGRWGEPRELYKSPDFANDTSERRTIHMGIDLFCAAGTLVRAPLDGVVEFVANNDREMDYGPMLIVGHEGFHTLYGHLSLDTLDRVAVGQVVEAGESIASVGAPPANGNWPPHLHFQQINDLKGLGVDFPGVALKSEVEIWLSLSPCPARFFPEVDSAALEYKTCA